MYTLKVIIKKIKTKNNLGLKFYLRIFVGFSISGVNYAYHSYKKLLRTAHSKKIFRHLTPIYIFLGPTHPF